MAEKAPAKRVSNESFTEDLHASDARSQPGKWRQKKVTAGCLFCHKWWTPVLWLVGILLLGVGIAAIVLLETKPWRADEPNFSLNNSTVSYPFVYIDDLVEMMNDERGVTVLDARRSDDTFATQAGLGKKIPGSVRAYWEDFLEDGVLKQPEQIAADFRSRGVFNDRPVVVYGGWSAANYWGEEGRIWWQLSWLNHTEAYILYGGIWAWDDRSSDGAARRAEQGDFQARPVASRFTDTETLRQTIQDDPESVFIVDARELGEFNGANPYDNAYGGHVPGAKSYHWRDAFDNDGNLRPREEVRATLLSLGFRDGMSLIAYCTRGVRASFLNAVLTWAGFETATYAGSWKEWSAAISQEDNEQLEADL